MPDFTLADILGAQAGAPGPVYEGGPTGNVTFADVLGPSWLDRARQQAQRDAEAYQRGGVPELLADTGQTQELAGGFGGTTKPVGIRAYHGSPYDFDKFDLSKIGTGEGAQAYGHGLYFAENPLVAQDYRTRLSPYGTFRVSGETVDIPSMPDGPQKVAAQLLLSKNFNAADARYGARVLDPKQFKGFGADDIANEIDKLEKLGASPTGKMYEVNINARPEQFLNYDAPFQAQSPQVQQGLVNTLSERAGKPVGPDWMDTFARSGEGLQSLVAAWNKHNPATTSAALNEAGIPGIRYLDQLSRPQYGSVSGARLNPGSETSNYVVFNPDIVDIRKKWALLLAAMGGVGAPTMGSVLQSQSPPPQ